MWSRNKKQMTVAEREHVERVKSLACGVCDQTGPSEAHELEQGLWWTCIPLCSSCHRDGFNGIHGQARIWKVYKKTEHSVLNDTIAVLVA